MAGIVLVVSVRLMWLVNVVTGLVTLMKTVQVVQMIVADVYLMNGHVLMATTLIHGVTVDVVLMIQSVMMRLQASGTTAEQMAA
jgi:hypothetical protein